ncbi:RDD family protein [Microbacterium sp.]|uniref:RDD family protein n=1 Tax=Microbacterium sp. TaxID=51671 RepID=UPI003A86B915
MTHRVPATLRARIGAAVINTLIAALIVGGVIVMAVAISGGFSLSASIWVAVVTAVAGFLAHTAMQGGAGSIGMRVFGLRLGHVDDPSGAPIGFGRALVRGVTWTLGSIVVVGAFSPLDDRSQWHRGWHDLAAGTVMTAARRVRVQAAPRPPVSPAADARPPLPPRPPAVDGDLLLRCQCIALPALSGSPDAIASTRIW